MKTLKFLGMALVAIMVVAGFTACSSDDDDDFTYDVKDYDAVVDGMAYKILESDPSAVSLVGIKKSADKYTVEIPSSVTINEKTYTVKSIGDFAFHCSNMGNVVVPEPVTSIGNFAFADCENLAGVDLPESLIAIGNNAFIRCGSLVSLVIPGSVTSIGTSVTYDCNSLKWIFCESLTPPSCKDLTPFLGFNGTIFVPENATAYATTKPWCNYNIEYGV